jgi:hypothetical protein
MVRVLSKFSMTVLMASIALMSSPVAAQRSTSPWSDIPDARTLGVQRKVDELYERGEFDRAYFIYRNELVPIGDKYAQYMVGYMHLMGRGVAEDPVAASAWYRLAAERGTPEFVAVRDQLMLDLNADERHRSDSGYQRLRRQFSDVVVLLNDIKRSYRELQLATGSRLPTASSPMTVVDMKSANQPQSGAFYYGRIERELEQKLVILAEIGDFPDLETSPDRVDINEVERRVNERLEHIQN